MNFSDINIIAVIAAGLANTIIGALWFNAPFLFNRQWLAGIGKSAEEVAGQASPLKPLSALVGALFTAYVLAVFFNTMGITDVGDGVLAGFLAGLAFSAVPAAIKDTFEGRSQGLTLINAAHDVVIFMVMGALIAII
ncbi:MAG: DUF1761 domain-containing protein [Aggregatilineales bacterium]